MAEFWEGAFKDKGAMWGEEPAKSALLARDFFLKKGIKKVLVPGFGYGRNARLFHEGGMAVTGIEISATAIELARQHFGTQMIIHHGSVTAMPFDQQEYDGIFCYGLIYLLDEEERRQLIQRCYEQLAPGGYMIFTAITKGASTYGKGTAIGKDRFEMFGGVKLFFYDEESVQADFSKYGLLKVSEVEENYPFYFITCVGGSVKK